jgi:hypothetical protein
MSASEEIIVAAVTLPYWEEMVGSVAAAKFILP